MTNRRLLSRLIRNLFAALVITGILSGLFYLGWFEQFNLSLSRSLLYRSNEAPDGSIVIVAIDEASLAAIGPLPWTYETYAQLLEQLEPASAVGLDAVLDTDDPAGLQRVAEVAASLGDVVFADGSLVLRTPDEAGELYGAPVLVRTHPDLRDAGAGTGHVNVLIDENGTASRVPLLIDTDEGHSEAFGLYLLRAHLSDNSLTPPPATFDGREVIVDEDQLRIDADSSATVWINFSGGPHSFTRYSAWEVIGGEVDPQTFEGKIVLVGQGNILGNNDRYSVPTSLQRMDGVEIQANVIDSLLHRRTLVSWGINETVAFILALSILASLGVTLFQVGFRSAVYMLVLLALYEFAASALIFDAMHVIPNVLYPGLAILMTYAINVIIHGNVARRQSALLESRFSHHVSPQLMTMLATSTDTSIVNPVGEAREITTLFTDIRGFTNIAERHDPKDVVATLNHHFDEMVKIVFDSGGYLNKYTGDGLMALYNAPLTQREFAYEAVNAAYDILKAARRLQEKGGPIDVAFEYGIGIATGVVVVGNIGGAGRLEYTAIGDKVNLSARLVALAGPGQILMDERTHALVQDYVKVNRITGVKVRGKAEEITVYDLVGITGKPKRRGFFRRG